MAKIVLSPRAKADIEEIWDYTVEHWSVGQAEIYIRQVQTAIHVVAAKPEIAKSCEAIRTGYWKYPAGSHVIFFKLISDGIDVVRILHSRMDFKRHF